MEKRKRSLLSYFYTPLAAATFILCAFTALYFAVYNISFSEEKIKSDIIAQIEKVSDKTPLQNVKKTVVGNIQLRDGYIYMYADIDAVVVGKSTQATIVATGNFVYNGPGFFSIIYNAITGSKPGLQYVTYNFYQFEIVPDTFKIGGKAAIETAIPSGQKIVEKVAKTKPGTIVTGLLKKFGKDTSDTARDAFTAKTMRQFEDGLIRLFSTFVKSKINGKTLYTLGENPAEQAFVSVFKGFKVTEGTFTIQLYLASLGLTIMIPAFTLFFGFGWWFTRALIIGRDRGVTALSGMSDEAAELLGNVADIADN